MFGDFPRNGPRYWITLVLILLVRLIGLMLMWSFHVSWIAPERSRLRA